MGWYGNGNAGDEAVLAGILCQLGARFRSAEVTVFGDRPDETKQRHGVASVWSLPWRLRQLASPPRVWRWRTTAESLAALMRTDLCLIGGGGIVADHSPRTVQCWCRRIALARRLAGCAAVYGVGVEPLARPESRALVRRTLAGLPLVTVRDEESAVELARCGIRRNVFVHGDPAMSVEPSIEKAPPEWTERMRGAVAVCPVGRYTGAVREQYVRRLVEGVETFQQQDGNAPPVVLAAMMPNDDFMAPALSRLPGYRGVVPLYRWHPMTVAGLLGQARVVVGSRLHSLILASLSQVPLVPVIYDIKVASFARRLGIEAGAVAFGDGMVWRREMFDPEALSVSLRAVTHGRIGYTMQTVGRLRAQVEAQADRLAELFD